MEIRDELSTRFGDNFSDSLTERLSHSADMGFVPQLVWSGIKIKVVPDYVVYPTTTDDLIDLVKIAKKYSIPIVPYGRATNRYGNAVPADGGILVDFSKMDRVSINTDEKEAIVQPGATWKLVDINAQAKGLSTRTFPSSYDSTVGGGVASDSLGIGSYEYGFVCDNVSYVKMVNPRGQLVTLSGKDLAIVCGAEGTTGLIAEVGLKLRQSQPVESLTISFDSLDRMIDAIGEFYKEVVPAWHVQVRGPSISSYIFKNFKAPLEPDKWNMVVLYPSQRAAIAEPKIKRIAMNLGGRTYEGEWTGWWSFNHGVVAALRTKGLLIHQHGLLNYFKLKELINSMSKDLGKIGNIDEGFDLDIDLERREILLVNAFVKSDVPPEDKKVLYELAKNTLMMEHMIKLGGSMLSVGIFVHQYAQNRLSTTSKTFADKGIDRYVAMKEYKENNDPDELFNPGKVFDTEKRATVINDIVRKQKEALTFKPAIGVAKTVSRGGMYDGFKVAKKFLDVFADYSLKCIDCAMCVTVCPQFKLIPQTPYAPKGMFDFVKGAVSQYYLEGAVDIPDSAIAELSGCHKCGLCDGVCPAKIPISSLLVRLNGFIAKKFPKEPSISLNLITSDTKEIIDDTSSLILWVGKAGIDNTEAALATLYALKKAGIKVKLVGTEGDTGFLDYIGGNGTEVMNKMKQNADIIRNADEIITFSPEDYRMFSEAYIDYAKMSGIPVTYETTPVELLLLKSIDMKGDEEINLHVACFSSGYAEDVIKRLREKGFRVRKVEGCSGAQLEKSLGKRADQISKAISERYKSLITLCPFAAAKFKSMGLEAMTLSEYMVKKAGVKIESRKRVTVDKEEEKAIRQLVISSIQRSLETRVPEIADTVTFVSSGLEDYEKIIEDVIVNAINEASKNITDGLRGIIAKKGNSQEQVLIAKEYIDTTISVLKSISFTGIANEIAEKVRSSTSETDFDINILKSALTDILSLRKSDIELSLSKLFS